MKERLDIILVQKGLVPSRDKAKRMIMAGLVTVEGRVEDKAGQKFDTGLSFALKEKPCPYVSRGGLKLEKALQVFPIDLKDRICMDMGASTGGFTDCMLQNGAKKVYALDVGYGQLDYRLRSDARVINREKTNIRYLDPASIPDPIDFISIDVSFISLSHMFPVVRKVLKADGTVVALIKPQFEAGREQVGKNGIVREPEIHIEVIEKVMDYARENDLVPAALSYSPVKGTKGNIEYLLFLRNSGPDGFRDGEGAFSPSEAEISPSDIVSEAHSGL